MTYLVLNVPYPFDRDAYNALVLSFLKQRPVPLGTRKGKASVKGKDKKSREDDPESSHEQSQKRIPVPICGKDGCGAPWASNGDPLMVCGKCREVLYCSVRCQKL